MKAACLYLREGIACLPHLVQANTHIDLLKGLAFDYSIMEPEADEIR